jgi:hypothetical protein
MTSSIHDTTGTHAAKLSGAAFHAEARERGASMPLTAALAVALEGDALRGERPTAPVSQA